jgi:hypothetical protein
MGLFSCWRPRMPEAENIAVSTIEIPRKNVASNLD